MRKVLLIFGLALLSGACRPTPVVEREIMAVSIEPQRAVLEALVGPNTEVITVLTGSADPETFEPTLRQRAALDGASLYFTTGVLPFERGIAASSPQLALVPVLQGVEPIYGTHGHSHGHDSSDSHDATEEMDPHYWTSVSGIRFMARNMAEALTALKPDSAAVYAARLRRFDARLDSVETALARRFAEAPHRSFAVWHPSLSYFARDYGLHQIAVGQEGKEMSARQLRHVVDEARADSVAVFFIQHQYDTRQAESIARELGARMIPIDPIAYDWEQQFNIIADELTRP